jgi:hypothetical protein
VHDEVVLAEQRSGGASNGAGSGKAAAQQEV